VSDSLTVLFVCTANICRSPFLELYARAHLASPGVAFASAGTHGLDGHAMSDEMATEAAGSWGLDPSGFRSRPLSADLVDAADLVLTVERRHRDLILAEHPYAGGRVLTLGQAARGSASADPGDDIADPYRLGAQAQAQAARQMSAMLDALPLPDLLVLTPARKPAHG
jgi:sulfate adenylyltransferase